MYWFVPKFQILCFSCNSIKSLSFSKIGCRSSSFKNFQNSVILSFLPFVMIGFNNYAALFCYNVNNSVNFHRNQVKITSYSMFNKIILKSVKHFPRNLLYVEGSCPKLRSNGSIWLWNLKNSTFNGTLSTS